MRSPLFLLTAAFFSVISATGQQKDPGAAPKIIILQSDNHASFRGLSAPSDKVVWVSGSNGQVGRSLDGGKTWQFTTVPGYEKRDFRDIEAFDADSAIIMAIAEPADILKTIDGGKTWQLVYQNKTPGMFLDAMEFVNNSIGVVIGDPIDNKIFAARTDDGGHHWKEFHSKTKLDIDSGEAFFASSGTNIRLGYIKGASFAFGMVSGGKRARFITNKGRSDLPIIQGGTSTGANSIAFEHIDAAGQQHIVVVGGDFAHDTSREKNACISYNGGKTWINPTDPPHGYRSCVEFIAGNQLITCGTSGVDISTDGGLHWTLISTTGFHVCRKAKNGNTVFLAGGNGRIAVLTQ